MILITRQSLRSLLSPAAACLILATGCSKPQPSTRSLIAARYAQRDLALSSKDLAGVFADSTPDWKIVSVHGDPITLPIAEKALRSTFDVATTISAHTDITAIAPHESDAWVNTTRRVDIDAPTPRTGEMRHITMTNTFRTQWLKTNAGWKESQTRTLTEGFTVAPTVVAPGP